MVITQNQNKTQRSNLMEKIIAQIAENFIKKILENISSGKKLEEIEPILLKNCKETAVKIVEEYIAVLDKEILSDKELRKNAVIR